MSEEKVEQPAWIFTEDICVRPVDDDGGWPKEQLLAMINPVLDFVEVHVSLRHSGMLVRLPKEKFVSWLENCQEILAKHAANPKPTDTSE